MRMHSAISILLAAWFVLSGMLGPRFQCLCADGTLSIEIGQQFCCDSDGGCTTLDEELCDKSLDTFSCPGGDCVSTPLSDMAVVRFEHGGERDLDTSLSMIQSHQFMTFTPYWTPPLGMRSTAHTPSCRTSGISHIRSVILLV